MSLPYLNQIKKFNREKFLKDTLVTCGCCEKVYYYIEGIDESSYGDSGSYCPICIYVYELFDSMICKAVYGINNPELARMFFKIGYPGTSEEFFEYYKLYKY